MLICISILLLVSCSYEPEPLEMGKDVCAHCKMTIVDPKWGAELVTNTGKIFKYDVVECMILHKKTLDQSKIHSIWTIDFLQNDKFIKAEDAIYVRSQEFNSPMGLNAVSLSNKDGIPKLNLKSNPSIIKWKELLNLVDSEFSE